MFRLTTRCKHKLELCNYGRVFFKCKKCEREWDTAGVEKVPYGYSSCKEYNQEVRKTGFVAYGQPYRDDLNAPRLAAKQIAPLLVEWVIGRSKNIDANNLRKYASDNPDEFVRQVNEQLGVQMR